MKIERKRYNFDYHEQNSEYMGKSSFDLMRGEYKNSDEVNIDLEVRPIRKESSKSC